MTTLSLKDIEAELQATGLPWRIEPGKKHRKIVIGSRMVGILPISWKSGARQNDRGLMNVLSQIRRAAREMKSS